MDVGPAGPTLESAFVLHQQGRLADAERAYMALLHHNPRDARALHLLGLLVAQTGRTARGAELIRHSLRIDPRRFLGHRDLGNLLLQSGEFIEALAS